MNVERLRKVQAHMLAHGGPVIRCSHCRSAVRTAYMAFLVFAALLVLYMACAERRAVRLPDVEQQIQFQPDLPIYKFSSCESKLRNATQEESR